VKVNVRRKRTLEGLVIGFLFVVAGLASMAAFVCMASEGSQGMTAEEIEQADRSERTCLLVALPTCIGAGAAAFALERRQSKRRAQGHPRR